ncbi:hypothetical protein HAX54_022021 [Datura stramonium]|uniref:Uncharacterized protein n=1 Tax=Datura stramonium TaxID=4076 RepID=A0ABS8UW01_DATST|nr:hypothetical protein [Datura stramonium]
MRSLSEESKNMTSKEVQECRDVIGSIILVKNEHLEKDENHLDNAISHVDHVAVFLCKLEANILRMGYQHNLGLPIPRS